MGGYGATVTWGPAPLSLYPWPATLVSAVLSLPFSALSSVHFLCLRRHLPFPFLFAFLSLCSSLSLPLFSSGLCPTGPSPTSAPSVGAPSLTPGTHSSFHLCLPAPPYSQLLLPWMLRTEGVGSDRGQRSERAPPNPSGMWVGPAPRGSWKAVPPPAGKAELGSLHTLHPPRRSHRTPRGATQPQTPAQGPLPHRPTRFPGLGHSRATPPSTVHRAPGSATQRPQTGPNPYFGSATTSVNCVTLKLNHSPTLSLGQDLPLKSHRTESHTRPSALRSSDLLTQGSTLPQTHLTLSHRCAHAGPPEPGIPMGTGAGGVRPHSFHRCWGHEEMGE